MDEQFNQSNEINQEVIPAATELEFKPSPEALAAAESALGEIKDRSFSGRHSELGKMINCQVCRRRHRRTDVAFREHFDENGNKTVTLEPLISNCKQVFKILWIDEDLETGKLETQFATVPLPGQNATPKSILGAAYFAKKRKNPHPSRRNHQFIRLVRRLIPDEYTQEDLKDARELAAEMLGWNKKKTYGYMPSPKKKAEVKNAQ